MHKCKEAFWAGTAACSTKLTWRTCGCSGTKKAAIHLGITAFNSCISWYLPDCPAGLLQRLRGSEPSSFCAHFFLHI